MISPLASERGCFASNKRSLRANQWSPADASSHKFRAARRDAAPASQRRASGRLASIMANQYFYVRDRRPRPNSAPERCLRDNTWTRASTTVRRRARLGRGAAGEPSRRRRVSGESPAPPRHRADVAHTHTHTHTLTLPHTETRECAQTRQRALGHRQREGRAASLHDVLTAKKSRTWVKVLESIMLKYIDIAVDLKAPPPREGRPPSVP